MSFRVQGIHLLDTMDDGTEMVAPDPFLPSFSPQQQDVDTSSGGWGEGLANIDILSYM